MRTSIRFPIAERAIEGCFDVARTSFDRCFDAAIDLCDCCSNLCRATARPFRDRRLVALHFAFALSLTVGGILLCEQVAEPKLGGLDRQRSATAWHVHRSTIPAQEPLRFGSWKPRAASRPYPPRTNAEFFTANSLVTLTNPSASCRCACPLVTLALREQEKRVIPIASLVGLDAIGQ